VGKLCVNRAGPSGTSTILFALAIVTGDTPMKEIKGKILPGEQTLIIFDKRVNPRVKKSDRITAHSKLFKVLRLETNWNTIAAEVEEIGGRKLDYSYFPGPNGDRYRLHVDLEML
jgi:hypothetical protein